MIQKQRCIVTGGAGFIGSHIVKKLLSLHNEVIVIDDLSTGKKSNLKDMDCTFIQNSLLDDELLKELIKQGDYIFHQAAIASVPRSVNDPLTTHEAGITATLKLLIAAKEAKAKRVILASSSSIYGDTPTLPKHEGMPLNPLSPYALTKATNEQYARMFYQLYGLQTISLRYFNVFGPNQDQNSAYAAVIPLFIKAIFEGLSPKIFGDGKQSRDFTFIDNVVNANLLAATAKKTTGEAINIAAGQQTTIIDLLGMINTILGTEVKASLEPPRKGDILHSFASIEKAKKLIGYEPKVDIKEGLIRTINWYRDQEKQAGI